MALVVTLSVSEPSGSGRVQDDDTTGLLNLRIRTCSYTGMSVLLEIIDMIKHNNICIMLA